MDNDILRLLFEELLTILFYFFAGFIGYLIYCWIGIIGVIVYIILCSLFTTWLMVKTLDDGQNKY